MTKQITQQTSDGYHTFEELYNHRHILFINVVLANKNKAFKTLKDNEASIQGDWFILGLDTAWGQISYHLPIKYFDKVDVKEIEYNYNYDGHNSNDVIKRLGFMSKIKGLE